MSSKSSKAKQVKKLIKEEKKVGKMAHASKKERDGASSKAHVVLSAPISRLIKAAHAQAPDGELYLPTEGTPPSQTFVVLTRRAPIATGSTGVAMALFFPLRTAMSDWKAHLLAVATTDPTPDFSPFREQAQNCLSAAIVATDVDAAINMGDDASMNLDATPGPAGVLLAYPGFGSPVASTDVYAGDRVRLVKATARVKYVGNNFENAGFPMWVPISNYKDVYDQSATGDGGLTWEDLAQVPGVVEFELKDYGWHSFTWLPQQPDDLEFVAGLNAGATWYQDVSVYSLPPGTLSQTYTGDGVPLIVPTFNVGADPTDNNYGLPLGLAFSFMPFLFVCVGGNTTTTGEVTVGEKNWMCELECHFERIGTQSSNLRPRVPDEAGLAALLAHTGGPCSQLYTPPGGEAAASQRTMAHVASAIGQTSQVVHGTIETARSVASGVGGVAMSAAHIAAAVGEAAELASGIGSLFI